MKINGNSIRPGNVIEHQGRLWRAVKIQHTQPGKGGAYIQVEYEKFYLLPKVCFYGLRYFQDELSLHLFSCLIQLNLLLIKIHSKDLLLCVQG